MGVAPDDVSIRANICYNFLAFSAYWFGAARFDMDGDGGFDAADAQAMMNRRSKAILLNFSRPATCKKAKGARRFKVEAKRQRAGQSISDTVDGIFDADVEEEEDEIMDNLMQYWPWFSVTEVLLCLGFWGVSAFNTRAYS
ncbi:unnamed protein product [Prorocentrum cordatum]|uniref:Uncharacterized protein n=1 Tax=Prorocentrum cordatum TaxID=2364126 RepID=A0ABN9QGS6_9DINO|nr:unnamed protein product [Polarella glacialis]